MHESKFLTPPALGAASTFNAEAAPPESGGERKHDPALASIEDDPGLARVLLVGDSISIGYTLPTRDLLHDVANVHRIPVNGASTAVGLANLDEWLATDGTGKSGTSSISIGAPRLEALAAGQVDLAGSQAIPLAQYEENLRELVARLEKTGGILIFATTTTIPKGSDGRVPGDEAAYNEVARRVMDSEGVAINDLHGLAAARLTNMHPPADVHFTSEGSQALAVQVAAEIRNALGKG